jgi:hypothetical protein
MKFRTRSGMVRLGSPTGHVHTLTEEWAELHERFHKEAYASGCVSEDMAAVLATLDKPAPDGEKPLHGDAARMDKVKVAIRKMLDGNEQKNFTAAGIPDLRILRAVADFEVTSDERDEAWRQVNEEL